MKNNYSIAERNRIVEENLHYVDAMICGNRRLIKAAHLDRDDVHQQLALRLIQAVECFDPEKGDLQQHIWTQLQEEMQDCQSSQRRYGFTSAPKDMSGVVIPLEACGDECLYALAA